MYNLDTYYFKIKDICEQEGLKIKRDFSISDGGNQFFRAEKSYRHNEGKLTAIFLTYYEFGFEVLGELKIDIENRLISIEFASWQVFFENNF